MDGVDEQIGQLASSGATLGAIASAVGIDRATVRRHLRDAGLQTPRMVVLAENRRARAEGTLELVRACPRHGESLHRADARGTFRCARCNGDRVADRRRVVKQALVDEAGGRCILCGYAKCGRALSFHHLDPATKEFNLARRGHSRGLGRARAEAAKCVLLCANCHMEVESGMVAIPLEFAPNGPG